MKYHHVSEVLVKPAGPDCNLDCDYCFYSGKLQIFPNKRTRMSDTVLEAMVSQLMAQIVPQISIGWQGGEPTLMGIPFYRKAVDLMQRFGRGQTVANGLQTNGLLIDKNWGRFFRDFHFLIGLSLDGPEHIHDKFRKSRTGKGSWQKALDASHLLQDYDVEVNVLTVVNEYSAQFPEEIYNFHKSQGLTFMQFIPCLERDEQDYTQIAPFSVSAAAYGIFLCKIFDLWLMDFKQGAPTTSIRFFEALLFQYAGFSPTECTLMDACGNYLLVEHTGDVYTCDFFVETESKLGNLLEKPLNQLFDSPQRIQFGQRKSCLPQDCIECQWKQHCNGGCIKDRVRNPVLVDKNYFCEAFKLFFQHADSRLIDLVETWKKNKI